MKFTQLNEEELQMVEDMAAVGFSPFEIAEVVQRDLSWFYEKYCSMDNPIRNRFRKGYLLGQLKLRKRIAMDAEHGSSPAQTLMKKIFDDLDYKLLQS